MTQDPLIAFVKDMLALIDERVAKVSFLATGATCTVWLVQSLAQKSYALRIIDKEDRVIDGTLDRFIRDSVLARGGRVGAFLLSSETTNTRFQGKRWGLDSFVSGSHPKRGALADVVCRHLGETLAVLHQLPVRGFGRPVGVEQGVLVGEQASAIKGVQQRFENPLPDTWAVGYAHPVLAAVPNLADEIIARLVAVTDAVEAQNAVICHSDLHEKQLLCTSDGLAALIDFGGASVLDQHWDLGSIYYFHGRDNFATLFDAYRESCETQKAQADLVPSFSIAIAMHHASRARLPGKQHRLSRAIGHIQQVIGV